MRTIKLFVKFAFTSLSPYAQPISLAVVSDALLSGPDQELETKCLFGNEAENMMSKSFYAEFSDFDINRCDDFVKENIISKLNIPLELRATMKEYSGSASDRSDGLFCGNTQDVTSSLKRWLDQFSDFNIQFVVDCSYLSAMCIVDLLDERVKKVTKEECEGYFKEVKFRLPELPSNIYPIVQDLNDLIAHTKGISVMNAFDLNREELAFGSTDNESAKYHTLSDVKTMKTIYNNLKSE